MLYTENQYRFILYTSIKIIYYTPKIAIPHFTPVLAAIMSAGMVQYLPKLMGPVKNLLVIDSGGTYKRYVYQYVISDGCLCLNRFYDYRLEVDRFHNTSGHSCHFYD